jgi:hypothetical protein
MKCFRSSPDRARRNPHLLQVDAKLTVMRSIANSRPALRMAAGIRSRLLRTLESGKPAVLTAGLPDKCRTGVRNLVRAGVPET